ncbi:hypothetical protein LCGC14_0851070, partial [marine sediment metagenome]
EGRDQGRRVRDGGIVQLWQVRESGGRFGGPRVSAIFAPRRSAGLFLSTKEEPPDDQMHAL